MMIIVGFVILFLLAYLNIKAGVSFGLFTLTIIGAVFVYNCIFNSLDEDNPKALDVYRNKTELQITYKGDEPVDTIVVFKENMEK